MVASGKYGQRIYLDNKTNDVLENICFTFGGEKFEDIVIKKLKAKPDNALFERKISQLNMFNMIGIRKLIMYYYDKNNNKHEYEIMDKLTSDFTDNIGVEILEIKDYGELEIKVTHHFIG